jgi:protein-tyrosine-phosphatase
MKTAKAKILFVCVENAGRSQMAQGFAELFGKEKVEVYSAGSRRASQIDPVVVDVMKERGIDLSSRRPKGLDDLPPVEITIQSRFLIPFSSGNSGGISAKPSG